MVYLHPERSIVPHLREAKVGLQNFTQPQDEVTRGAPGESEE
jgi:hypothetical protein